MSPRTKTIISWIARAIAALIMLQTLFFKFTAAEESVYIFSSLHMEPWGRIGTGIMELIASVLILIPRTTAIGALLALGLMGGAMLSHIFFLGIAVQGDRGQLFIYAAIVFFCALYLLIKNRRQLLTFVPSRYYETKD
ncbi:MAG TPA: DoxX family protein [Flavitalea sp.]|nr:DoxX family protein [Flavitalea sp.]